MDSSGKIYVLRHVVFNKHVFPFADEEKQDKKINSEKTHVIHIPELSQHAKRDSQQTQRHNDKAASISSTTSGYTSDHINEIIRYLPIESNDEQCTSVLNNS